MRNSGVAKDAWLDSELAGEAPENHPAISCNRDPSSEQSSLHMFLSKQELQDLLQSELQASVKDVDNLLKRRLDEAFEQRGSSMKSNPPMTLSLNPSSHMAPVAMTPAVSMQPAASMQRHSRATTEVHHVDSKIIEVPIPQMKSMRIGTELKEAQHMQHLQHLHPHKNCSTVVPRPPHCEHKSSVEESILAESEFMSQSSEAFAEITPAQAAPSHLELQCGTDHSRDELSDDFEAPSFVRSNSYDMIVALLVCLNAIIMGVQIHWEAVHKSKDSPSFFRIADVSFCIAFVLELICRCWVYRWELVTGPDWHWNSFDFLLVGLQLIEEFIAMVASATNIPSLGSLRVLRVMRLLRVMRFVRLMRLLGELRILILAIAASMKSLFWTLVLIALDIYICALVFTQIVTDHRVSSSSWVVSSNAEELERMFGSVPKSTLTLFQAISGADWQSISLPMDVEIGWGTNVLFVAYIGFMVLALQNVVTGVFVDSALTKTKEHSDLFMINNVREIFGDLSHSMSWDEFEQKLTLPSMTKYFEFLDVDSADARALFSLVDVDSSGTVDAEEFLSSCLRLKGPAKALDMQLLMREVGGIWGDIHHLTRIIERSLNIEDGLSSRRKAELS